MIRQFGANYFERAATRRVAWCQTEARPATLPSMRLDSRGIGDEGIAVDLLPLARVDLEPRFDAGPLATVLVAAEAARATSRRAELLDKAKRLAGTTSFALALVKMTIDRL